MMRGNRVNTDEEELLLPLVREKTVPDAPQKLVERFQKKVAGRTQETFTCRDYLMEVVAFTLATASGLMYWNSSEEGGEHWAKYLGTNAALYASQVGASVSNVLFNWVAYRRLLNARSHILKKQRLLLR